MKEIMIIPGVLIIAMIPCLGILINEIGRKKEINQIETYLSGFFFLFLLQGVVFFLGMKLQISFQKTSYLLYGILSILALVGVLLGRDKLKEYFVPTELTDFWKEKKNKYLWIAFLLVVGAQLFTMVCYMPEARTDIMLETVSTTLSTNTMYQYHPLTGNMMNLGMITTKQIITLPLWYSFLTYMTTGAPAITIYIIGSLCTVLASYAAYTSIFSVLFPKNKKKVLIALIFLGLLYLSGDYSSIAMGYGQLYYGYSGEIICISVVIPYIIFVICSRVEGWILKLCKVGICLLSTIFMTSVQTGLLYGVLIIAVMLAMNLILRVRRKRTCK